ncbi:DUF2187 domain-containing protein [Peribacillus saganii]|uniref:DUF2187 domain-containing protein n=1 Tax=Peribacillus saganii TaxID=2303992 RepID=A0A372LR36_9BACI|nr:DUF2187 family protein [Peribacillus saganii]RFU69472.1 DUF2187 domain-containing protein [Peribacillus saganii]
MTMANIGDEIVFKNTVKGIVEKVNENSVIVVITSNPEDVEFLSDRTVVNHKNYKVVKQSQAVPEAIA